MRRPDGFSASPRRCGCHPAGRPGYTLVEILTATVLMIIIMLAVTVIFASVTESIGQSRATLEMTQRLRSASALLKQDLENVTVAMTPPCHPRDNSGYFEYVEGPIGPVVPPEHVAWNIDAAKPDSTVGDIDDILMFTAKTEGEPYVGLVSGVPTKSNTAEIIWFIRGRTLYRRVLLVKPDASVNGPPPFYGNNDLSVHRDWMLDGTPFLAANSLADLTRPECRFAHHPDPRIWTGPRPTAPGPPPPPPPPPAGRYKDERRPHAFFYRPWLGAYYDGGTTDDPIVWVPGLGLPILAECSAGNWAVGDGIPINDPPNASDPPTNPPASSWLATPYTPNIVAPVPATGEFDAWANPHPWGAVNPLTGALTGYSGTRIGEDVVLTNVVGFDVKAWDPYAPILDNNPPPQPNDPPKEPVPLMPGDPGYIKRITNARSIIGDSLVVLGTGAYVDLNYLARLGPAGSDPFAPNLTGLPGPSWFCGPGSRQSRVYGTLPFHAINQDRTEFYPAVYDTWSLHYEFNRRIMRFPNSSGPVQVGDEDLDGVYDRGSNGIDDDGQNGVDDIGERETQPPYAAPLQGIQVRIRTFEPGSRQVREVTLVQKFRTR